MKIQIILNDDDVGYLSKLLKFRYNKSPKTALSTLLLLAANEVAEDQAKVAKLEGVYGQLDRF
jgi:hypothetical protein